MRNRPAVDDESDLNSVYICDIGLSRRYLEVLFDHTHSVGGHRLWLFEPCVGSLLF